MQASARGGAHPGCWDPRPALRYNTEAMGYRVQTPDGEMTYGNLEQLRQAVDFGLVGLDEPVTEDGVLETRTAGRILGRTAATPSELRRRARRFRAAWVSYGLMAIALAGLLARELPRPTIVFPWLTGKPALALVAPPPAPGGAVALPQWVWTPSWLTLPTFGWVDVAVASVLLLLLLWGLRTTTLQGSAFFTAAGGYFFATGRLIPALVLWGAALLLGGNWVTHWMRRPS